MPLCAGRNQDHQRCITAGNEGFDVDAVVRAEGLFCQNDDWITHAPSLVGRRCARTDWGMTDWVPADWGTGCPRGAVCTH
ncbi:hypothetical protein NicSoilB4_14590 [Arthrobacter sp. NicSoilB4]|nr:hypothetical protein NicSoilB4_14590 [Arthrobacter sp. NicSoilB4]